MTTAPQAPRPAAPTTPPAPTTLDQVKGWFPAIDQRLFTWFLDRQRRLDTAGGLLELGCYLGKSAILLGRHLGDGETFTVCDLFDSAAPDAANQREMDKSYATLTRTSFESNYLAFHDRLPEIVQAPTSAVLDHVKPGSCRFVHVDASHLYEHVRSDIEAAHAVLAGDGIVVCDDYRSEHTPGVAAAVWEAVAAGGLRPICVTPQKLYGTWGDAGPVRDELLAWAAADDDIWHEVQEVAGGTLARIKDRRPARADSELRKARERLSRAEAQVLRLKEELRADRRRLDAVRGSVSFRAGRALTAPPRAMRRLGRRD